MAALAAVALFLLACQSAAPPQASPPAPGDPAALMALVQKGDYAGAIAFVEKSSVTATEKDGVIGTLILDGLADRAASTRPPYPLREGFTRMERAASAGRKQSIADLRARFTTGLNDRGKNVLVPPVPELARCWADVEDGKQKAASCIANRERLKLP